MRRHWALWVLILALAACNNDKKRRNPKSPHPEPEADATQEVEPGYEIGIQQPGLKVRNGLALLSHNEGVIDGTGYFYGEGAQRYQPVFRQLDAQPTCLSAEGVQFDDSVDRR